MRFIFSTILVSILSLSFLSSYAQVTSVPEQAKANFFKQYPDASNIKWENDIVNVNVRFEQEGDKMNAEYNNKGIWKSTLKDWTFDKLVT